MERLKNQKIEAERIQISEGVLSMAREETLAGGTFYVVPLSKYDRYPEGPTQVTLTSKQAEYFNGYINNPQSENPAIGVDLEHLLPYITDASEIGLEPDYRNQFEEGLVNLVSIPQSVLQSDEFREMFFSLLSPTDKERLEVDYYDPQIDYLHAGVLLRADLLLKEDGRPLSCDPNLMPLGYSIMHELASSVEKNSGIEISPNSDYLEALINAAQNHPNQISGIITGTNYPNWLSHMTQARILREKGSPYYVLPTSVMREDGTIDIKALNEFNDSFGINPIDISNDIPGVVVRYSRETKILHPDSEVINAAGIRLLETQIWPGLMTLPGFYEMARSQGVTKDQVDSALRVAVPTLVLKAEGDKIDVATALIESENGYELRWENLEERPDLLLAALLMNGANNPSEKPKELSWYIKTLSTSGNKGTAFTNDGRIDQTVKTVRGRVQKFGFDHGGLFLLQPKIRSMLFAEAEDERIKIDHFVSLGTGKTVSIDYMSTPKNQRAAHGGSSTRIGLVKL